MRPQLHNPLFLEYFIIGYFQEIQDIGINGSVQGVRYTSV